MEKSYRYCHVVGLDIQTLNLLGRNGNISEGGHGVLFQHEESIRDSRKDGG